MKEDKRSTIKRNKVPITVFLLILIAWMCRVPPFDAAKIPFMATFLGLVRPIIYMGLCVAWSISVSRKILNYRLRFYLNAMAFCCILWLFIRTVKYELTSEDTILSTALVHGYTPCFILILTFAFFASLYARRSECYYIPLKISGTISFISVAASLFVITNPLHKLYWTVFGEPYTHGPGYKFVMAWLAVLLIMTMVTIIARAKVPSRKKAASMPLLVTIIIIAYFSFKALQPELWKYLFGDYISFTCIALIGIMQACISSGMIPSNKDYVKVFEALEIGMVITDDDWSVHYTSADANILSREVLEKTESADYMFDVNTKLKGHKLHPGHVVWKEDISALNNVLEKLAKNKEDLSVQNEIDMGNNRVRQEIAKAQEKNRLYDIFQKATVKQNKRLTELIKLYFEETDINKKNKILAEAAVIGSYIKRKGNMIFIGESKNIKASELKLCFAESLSNLKLLETEYQLDFLISDEQVIPFNTALCLYDSFEAVIEATLLAPKFVYVRITSDDEIKAVYRITTSIELEFPYILKEANIENDGDSWILTLSFPKGGDLI